MNDDFDHVAKKVATLFPNEIAETYYVDPVKKSASRDNKPGRAKGKLIDKYRNIIAIINRANRLREENRQGARSSRLTETIDGTYIFI